MSANAISLRCGSKECNDSTNTMECRTIANGDNGEKCVFRPSRRYSKAEEAMHEDDRPLARGEERRFSSTESPTVVTTPYIWAHSVKEAENQIHLMARMRDESVNRMTNSIHESSRRSSVDIQQLEDAPPKRRLSIGEGGLGDHSARCWDWPLGEQGGINIRSNDKVLDAWLDFRPFEPNEIWAKIMGNILVIHCKSKVAHPGNPNEFFRTYTLPMNCDARTARFRIRDGHILVIKVEKDQPIKLAVANFTLERTKVDCESDR